MAEFQLDVFFPHPPQGPSGVVMATSQPVQGASLSNCKAPKRLKRLAKAAWAKGGEGRMSMWVCVGHGVPSRFSPVFFCWCYCVTS